MNDLEMLIDLNEPISSVELPCGYSIVCLDEDNGHLYDEVMDSSFGGHPPGAYRYAVVSNYSFDTDKVFVLMNENNQPIATATAWDNVVQPWEKDAYPEIIFVGVKVSEQGRKFGALMTMHALYILQSKGYTKAHLGIRNTSDGENYPAVKTYINCGFVPYITENDHVEAWNKVYSYLSLPKPEFVYDIKDIKPDEPHPPLPWPYQIRRAAEAMKTGDRYLFGEWARHNLYLIFPDRYYQLKYIVKQSANNAEIIDAILTEQVENIYINHPYNPVSMFLYKKDKTLIRIGESLDSMFEKGIERFLSENQ